MLKFFKVPVNVILIVALGVTSAALFFKGSSASPEVVEVKTPVVTESSSKSVPLSTKKVVRVSPDSNRMILIYSQIMDMSSYISKLKELDKQSSKEPIWVLLNSPGGSVFDGALFISQMEATKAPVYTVCMGLCASMAAIIHQHGVKRFSIDRSVLMFHPASGGLQGQVENMDSRLSLIKRVVEKFNARIASRSKMTQDEYKAKVAYELWLDAEDAKEKGFVDEIIAITTDINPVSSMLGDNKADYKRLIDVKLDIYEKQ